MKNQTGNDLYRRCLMDVLLPAMSGIFTVTILMSGLYWLALRSLRLVLPPEQALYTYIVENVGYYSLLTAIAVALSTVTFLLITIKYIAYLSRPLKLASELENYSSEFLENDNELRARIYVFKKFRERVIVLVGASMAAPFLLLGGLYLAIIATIYRFGNLKPPEINVLFQVLGHYGTLVLLVIVISGIMLVIWSFYRLKITLSIGNLSPEFLAKILEECPENCRELEREIEQLLLLADIRSIEAKTEGEES